MYKGFKTLRDAKKFMADNRTSPPSLRTPWPPHNNTPLPHREYIFPGETFSPTVQIAPPNVYPHEFSQLRAMAKLITHDEANLVLDPPECTDPQCKFARGPLMQQRFCLLRRLFQLNAQLGADPPANPQDDADTDSQ